MKKLDVDEIKKLELEILKDIAEFCEKNDLEYYLAYGTLIGAVRHKGFIPWDDDIDIQMPRKDYEYFLENYKHAYYEAVNPYSKKAKHSYAKVIDRRTVKYEPGFVYEKGEEFGVDVDIFPLDGQPKTEKKFKKFYCKKYYNYLLFNCSVMPFKNRSFKGKIKYSLASLIAKIVGNKNYFLKKAEKINEDYTYEDSKYIGSTTATYSAINNRFLKKWYEDFCYLEFENMKFKAPINYHEVLTKLYGNYMELPPKDEQVTHHVNEVYLLEK